jgi:ABC-type antimicrobial peptide transport system permease subunit
VKDARDRGLKNEAGRVVYSSFEHEPLGWLAFAVRVRQDSSAVLQSIAAAARNSDPAVPVVSRVQKMEFQIEESLGRERMMAVLLSVFGGLATAVAAIGLYGLLAYAIARRTREIGVRIAIGATSTQVAWLALKDSIILMAVGVLTGISIYFALSQFVRAQLYGVSPKDPAAIATAGAVLTIAAAIATLVPAWRAVRVDPIQALRYE